MDSQRIKPEVWVLLTAAFFLALTLYFFFKVNQLESDIRLSLETVRSLETLPSETVDIAEIEAIYARVQESEARALGYLGVFEAVGVGITVLGILGTIIGVTVGFSVREAQAKFEETKREIDTLDKKARDANLAQFYVSLAATQRALGNMEGASENYRRAATLTPKNPVPYYHIAYISTQLSDFDAAEELLNTALSLDTEFPHAYAGLGFVYRRRGDEDAARRQEYYTIAAKHLNRALYLMPHLVDDDGESWHGALAGMYRRMGNDMKAIHHYKKAEEVTPLSSYPILNRLRLEWKLGRSEAIRQSLNQAEKAIIRKIDIDEDTYWDRGDLLFVLLALGKNDEAQEALDFFLHILPKEVVDVLPRVIEATRELLALPAYDGDLRDMAVIDAVLQKLEQAQEERILMG